MTTWRIILTCTLAAGALAASSGLMGCDNDVDTPPWLPNYTASGYGGKAGAGGKSGGAGDGAKAGAAGDASDGGSSGSNGEGGDAP
jgi:hypothetical protein